MGHGNWVYVTLQKLLSRDPQKMASF